jgi:hypothetical protein
LFLDLKKCCFYFYFSERADPNWSLNYKGRLKEGSNINKSLVTLGNVIKSLGIIILNNRTASVVQSKGEIIIISLNVTCSRHDIAEKVLIWHSTTIAHSLNNSKLKKEFDKF